MSISNLIYIVICAVVLPKEGQCDNNDDYDHHAPRILNGREALKYDHPYNVYLNITDTSGGIAWYCGGSLIDPEWILTAAHCLSGAIKADIILGAHDITKQEPSQITISTRQIIPHPKFRNGDRDNDIGLIRLPYPVPLSREIKPIKLPKPTDAQKSLVGKAVKIMGWGLITRRNEVKKTSSYLIEGNTHIISNTICRKNYPTLTDMDLCLSGQRRDKTCMGDSGGPVIMGDVQIGVVSYKHVWCDADIPSVATNVSDYLSWINKTQKLHRRRNRDYWKR